MRKRLVGALSVLALILCGCLSPAAPGIATVTASFLPTLQATATSAATTAATPAVTPAAIDTVLPTAEPTGTPAPTATHSVVVLHGTFVGHESTPETTGDATFNVDLNWNRPVDVHNMLEFQFASGSFSASASAFLGDCGGAGQAAGAMRFASDSDHGALAYGDAHSDTDVTAELIDNRLNQGGLILEFGAGFLVEKASLECNELWAVIGDCGFEFQLLTMETMQTDLSCSKDGNNWTGHLAP